MGSPSFKIKDFKIHPLLRSTDAKRLFRSLRRAPKGYAPLDERSLFEKSDVKTS